MKRLIATGLALSLLGSSAAMAHDYGRNSGYNYGHSAPYRGGYDHGYRYRDNGNTAAVVGVGILALGLFAALAANNNRRDEDYGPSYGYGSSYGYAPSYGNGPSYPYDNGPSYRSGYGQNYSGNYGYRR